MLTQAKMAAIGIVGNIALDYYLLNYNDTQRVKEKLATWGIELEAGKNLEVAGEKINLEDILVTRTSRADIVLETAGNLTVALETNLTKELIQEGLMRETLSQLQKMRKDLDFKVTDRVKLTLHTDSIELKEALSLYKDYLTEELLVKELFWGDSGTQILAIDKHMLQVSLE